MGAFYFKVKGSSNKLEEMNPKELVGPSLELVGIPYTEINNL
jgi:hypothetical protein